MKKAIIILLILILITGCSNQQDINNTLQNTQTSVTPEVTATLTPTIEVTPTPTSIPTASHTPSPTPEPLYLEGYRIGIDPGHQRHENDEMERMSPYNTKEKKKVSLGTKGSFTGVREYAFNLDLAFLLKAELEAQGAEVFMTRETNDVDISNQERAKMMNELECDFWIRIHANWNEHESTSGISTLTPKVKSVSTFIYEESKHLSGLIQKNVIATTGAVDHGLSYRSTITGFNWSRIPVTLIECGYMSNEEEDNLLQTYEYRMLLVQGIVQGMIDYVNDEEFPSEYEYVPR